MLLQISPKMPPELSRKQTIGIELAGLELIIDQLVKLHESNHGWA